MPLKLQKLVCLKEVSSAIMTNINLVIQEMDAGILSFVVQTGYFKIILENVTSFRVHFSRGSDLFFAESKSGNKRSEIN